MFEVDSRSIFLGKLAGSIPAERPRFIVPTGGQPLEGF
jgi:hypothetical protein